MKRTINVGLPQLSKDQRVHSCLLGSSLKSRVLKPIVSLQIINHAETESDQQATSEPARTSSQHDETARGKHCAKREIRELIVVIVRFHVILEKLTVKPCSCACMYVLSIRSVKI